MLYVVLVVQLCPTLCSPMDCSLPGSLAHGILQARILEWVVIPYSRGSSRPRAESGCRALQAYSLPSEPPRKPHIKSTVLQLKKGETVLSLLNKNDIRKIFMTQIITMVCSLI